MSEQAGSDDPLSPTIDGEMVELDRYSLSTVIYAERSDGHVLLLQRAEGSALAGQFFPPGGIVDPGEDPWDAARRELVEETGLVPTNPLTMVGCCLLYTSPSPRDATLSRMPSSA